MIVEEFNYYITKDDINEKPLGKYDGDIFIIDSDALLKDAVTFLEKYEYIGFDTESKPSFRKGEHHPVALIQLAVEDRAFLIRVQQIEDISPLEKILSNPAIAKIGLGLSRELEELLDETGLECLHFIDLEKIAALNKFKQRGVRALAAFFLDIRISKSAQKSNWERQDLTNSQKYYAATDAWVCLKIYKEMLKKEFITKTDENQFVDKEYSEEKDLR